MTHRFLLVQLADMGDLILTTPAIAALREAHPAAHIALLTTTHSAPVLNRTHLVNDIITIDQSAFDRATAFFRPANLRRLLPLRQGRYDTIIYFHHFTLRAGTLKYALIALAAGSKRRIGLENGSGWFLTDRLPDEGFGAKHQAQYWLDLVGLAGANPSPRPAVVGKVAFNPDTNPSKKKVIIHPGGGGYSLARRWEASKFAAVADALHETYQAQIILVGGTNDNTAAVKAAMRTPAFDLTGQTTLNQLAGLLAEADLFIGAESGVMHLAAAVGVPVVAIFGPGNPDAWGPYTPNTPSVIVRSAPECSPCSYVRHTVGLREGCAAVTCMRMVTPDDVLKAAKTLLNNDNVGTPYMASLHLHHSTNRLRILGLPVDAITYDAWLNHIDQWIESGKPHHVCTINPEMIMIAQRDSLFFSILARADLCVPDGVGLLYAARYLGKPLPQRVTGSDGVPIIAARAAEKGWRLFLLGGAPGVAEKAAAVLQRKHPDLKIAGTYSGNPTAEEEDALVERVNTSDADILFVAYGAPEQDKWIARNLPRLRVTMAMGVGGAFDFIAGIVPRAPLWMQRLGLEWLYRLYLQPWRIRRMLRLPRFVLGVLLRGRS